jgi:hypothetical protein
MKKIARREVLGSIFVSLVGMVAAGPVLAGGGLRHLPKAADDNLVTLIGDKNVSDKDLAKISEIVDSANMELMKDERFLNALAKHEVDFVAEKIKAAASEDADFGHAIRDGKFTISIKGDGDPASIISGGSHVSCCPYEVVIDYYWTN